MLMSALPEHGCEQVIGLGVRVCAGKNSGDSVEPFLFSVSTSSNYLSFCPWCVCVFQEGCISLVRFSPGGSHVAVVSGGGHVSLWELNLTGQGGISKVSTSTRHASMWEELSHDS